MGTVGQLSRAAARDICAVGVPLSHRSKASESTAPQFWLLTNRPRTATKPMERFRRHPPPQEVSLMDGDSSTLYRRTCQARRLWKTLAGWVRSQRKIPWPMTKLRDLWNDEGYLLKKDGDNEVRICSSGMAVADMDTPCPSCSKPIGDHTPEEIWSCATPK